MERCPSTSPPRSPTSTVRPHLGHAYEAISTDVLARHMRQRGEDVFFLTGTDEHGEPVADAAHAEGVEPQELADRNAERFKALMPLLEVSNDFFIRTTDPAARAAGPGGAPARPRQRPHLQGHLRGLVLPALRRLQGRERDPRGQPVPDPRDPADPRAGGELVLPAVDLPGAARAPVRRAARLRDAAGALQRGAVVHRLGAPGRLAVARAPEVGRAGSVGPGPRLLRLVRRAAQLLHGARLRARRRRPDLGVLAGDLPRHRQGHPQVPHDLSGRRY